MLMREGDINNWRNYYEPLCTYLDKKRCYEDLLELQVNHYRLRSFLLLIYEQLTISSSILILPGTNLLIFLIVKFTFTQVFGSRLFIISARFHSKDQSVVI